MYVKRLRNAEDSPTIWMIEGRFMLGCGVHQWRKRWHEYYKFEVEAVETPRGLRIDLDSLISAVYPALAKDPKARATFAINFLWRLREERRRSAQETKNMRLEKETNEGDTK
jgi:hypothetical protein